MRGGETIELISDLGGGKTAFVRGLTEGLGSHDTVTSPSFTLRNEYRAGDHTLYHFDFYRLHEPGILRDELAELLTDPKAVVAVEWADVVADVLPPQRITVHLKVTGEESRNLSFTYPSELEYVFEGVQK
ncbi:MAG TPA: tRNA (adenosine(37)-N6)-threonylcarbamoyltransferase complex ATPase subunit type 1 TsaE [Candidatus Saccharimonadales bacterium]|nr:tRNA (adenosine(37)-N6)-threonylcarbamoyltransferase complex ATPase subunit type 1 TsaE [Candidatus Saccharimonadales bacterium]